MPQPLRNRKKLLARNVCVIVDGMEWAGGGRRARLFQNIFEIHSKVTVTHNVGNYFCKSTQNFECLEEEEDWFL